MKLSKSDYIAYLKHPAWLWLKKHAKNLLPPVDPATQAIFDQGHQFEQYAEALFPSGERLGFSDYDEYISLPDRTTQAIEDGLHTIFQGRFECGELTFICDVIQVVNGKEVDLLEIKSSTSVKPEHIVDLAFQMVVLEKCGFIVREISVIHVNNRYVRKGAIDPKLITAKTDVTESVKAARESTLKKISEALKVMSLPECPDISPLYANSKSFSEWLEIYKNMKSPDPGSIYALCQLDAKTLRNLKDENITQLKDIPADFPLKSKQRRQIDSLIAGQPNVQYEKVKEFLDSLTYPIYFLDYETLGSLVPYFDGLKPYQQLPFQYSLHILDSPDSGLRHEEFLQRGSSNPAEPLSEALKSHIGSTGTIVTWNMVFEKGCNSLLGLLLPEHTQFFENLNDRIVDLKTPFSSDWYVDARFKGSASIKSVLPVLVPELSYDALNIKEGNTAQRLWMEVALEGKHKEDTNRINEDLLRYCELDTLAMVEIYKKLTFLLTNKTSVPFVSFSD